MRQIVKEVIDGSAVGRIRRGQSGYYVAEIGIGSYLLTVRSRQDLEALIRIGRELLPFAGVLPTVAPVERLEGR